MRSLSNPVIGRRTDPRETDPRGVVEAAARHSLAWLAVANLIGVLLSVLLLLPGLNGWLDGWTYGRWMPCHLNLELYGWGSLPLVAWLLKVYGAGRPPVARWGRSALWAWSAALAVGAASWLGGETSGKLFLDWRGYPRILFSLAVLFLWGALAWSFRSVCLSGEKYSRAGALARIAGLVLLLPVPAALYWASGPSVYPPVNPDTGGPTGASLLESTLGVIAVLLVLPAGFDSPPAGRRRLTRFVWRFFGAQTALALAIGHGNESHHRPAQIFALGSLLPWMFLIPAFYKTRQWPAAAGRWFRAFSIWWVVLLASGWLGFLPGALDRLKFTDALVGHAHMAMAGFVSSLNIFLLASLVGASRRVFDALWAFVAWQAGTAGYVVLMFAAGWVEGGNPAFSFVPGPARNLIYTARLLCGGLMAAASCHWLLRLRRESEDGLSSND